MSISYDKAQRDRAKRDKLHLVTIDALGISFQGPVDRDEAFKLFEYLKGVLSRREPPKPDEPPAEGGQ